MKKLIFLFSFLALGLSIQAQSIDSVVTTSPILCNNQTGDITVYTDVIGVVVYDVFAENSNGVFQPYMFGSMGNQGTSFNPIFQINNLMGSNYIIRLLDPTNLTVMDADTHLLVNPQPLNLVNVTSTPVSCFNGNDGTASIIMQGGVIPYQYLWSDTQTTDTAIGLSSGTYSCSVIDDNGCVYSGNPVSVLVTQPNNPVNSTNFAQQFNVACHGDSTGFVGLNPSGGTPPYSYFWSSGDTSSSISNLPAGTYSVLVEDNNGCSQGSFSTLPDSNNYVISQPLLPISVNSTLVDVACKNEATGSITLSPIGGNSPYQYDWSSGQTTQSINNIIAGTYVFTVTDANGCIYIDSVEISEPDTIFTSLTNSTPTICFGESNGQVQVSASGGNSPYLFLWNNGSTSSTINNLSADWYSVDITDNGGCTISDSVEVLEPTKISNTFSGDSISCPIFSDGLLRALGSGGTAPYNYTWSSTQSFNIINDSTIGNLSQATYSVVIDDINSCSQTFEYVLGAPSPISIQGSTFDVACHSGNTGSISLNITGATPPYTYLWNNGQTTSSLSSLSAGIYTVTITDSAGCYGNLGGATDSWTVSEPSNPLQNTFISQNVICHADSNGFASSDAGGGTSPYTYLWSTTDTTQTVSNLTAGNNYFVTITDANGCQLQTTFNIDEPSPINLVTNQTNPTCYGYSDGFAAVIPTGGNPSYTYLWPNNNGHTGQTINNLSSGPISVTVTDSLNCTASSTFQIGEPSPLTVSITTNDNICFDGTSGSANTQITNSFPPFTFTWSNLDTTPNITNLIAGTYGLIVTNANGCMQDNFYLNSDPNTSTSFDILEPTEITVTSNVTDITAYGADDGIINVAPSGGTPSSSGYQYAWTGPLNYTSNNGSINNLTNGLYNLVVTDANGCTYNETFNINEPGCNVSIDTTYLPPLCHDDNAEEFTWINSGGVAPYITELFDNNGNVWYGPNSGLDSITLLNTIPPGLYTITVTDNSGCSSVLNIPVDNPDSLIVNFVSNDLLCFEDNTGSISAIASGGTPANSNPYSYLWSNGNQISFSILNLSAGTYSVVVTDDNNCQVFASHTINQPNLLVVDSISSTFISCNPGVDGTASVFVSGGILPYNYLWAIPNSGIPQTTQTASNLSVTGNYFVQITDNNGCLVPGGGNVFVDNAPNLLLTDSVIQPLCNGDTNGIIYANASGGTLPYSYSWSLNGFPGQYSTSPFIANLSPATYSVIVEDHYGCVNQFTQQISNPQLLNVSLSPINVSLNGANDGSITTTVNGGTGVYSYIWSGPNGFNSTQANISFLFAGTYTLIVADNNGCIATNLQVINQPICNVSFDSTITFSTQPLCFGQSGSINWMANGGGQTLNTTIADNNTGTILFSQATSPNISYSQTLLDGNYYLYVEDQFGCPDVFNFVISSPNVLSANLVTDSVSCFGGSDGSMSLQGVGGTPPYYPNYGTFPITGSPVDENQLPAGTYTVFITDSNGCSSFPGSYTAEIFEPAQIIVSPSTVSVLCHGGQDGEIHLSVSGGTSPYNYLWLNQLQGLDSSSVYNLTANIYFVTVTDANGCGIGPVQINPPPSTSITVPGPNANLSVSISVINANCFGGSDGSAEANPSGGTPPFSYVWNDGQTTKIAQNLTSGTYTCVVTDANGCIDFATTTVGEPNEIFVNLSTTHVSCYGFNDGSALVNPTGGSGTGFSVEWGGIFDPITGLPITNLNVSSIIPGIYNVTVTDLSPPFCSVSENVIIGQPDFLQITPNVEQIVNCFQGSDGSLSVSVLGGTTPYSYNWSSNLNNSVAITAIADTLSSQMYYIDVTDANGCSLSDSIFLSSNDEINPNLTFDNVSCYGGNDGIAYANPTGGTAPYNYFWSFSGSTTSSSTGLSANTPYSVTIFDANNCTLPQVLFSILEPDSVSMLVSIDSVSCFMGTDGQININSISGANGGYQYSWSNGSVVDSASNLIAGVYTCVVTDNLGCIDSSNVFTVYEPNQLIADITITTNFNGSNITCFNDSTGQLTASATGGVGSYSFTWFDVFGDTLGTTNILNNLNAGIYKLTVTDINGCSSDATMQLVNPDTIHFNYSISNYNGNNVSCYGFSDGTLSVNISGGSGIDLNTVEWTDNNGILLSPFNIINDTTLINIGAGTYHISVSDFNGCTSSSSVTLTEPDSLENYFTTDSVTCNGGINGSAYSNVSGGTAPYTYSWTMNSSDSSSANGLIANMDYILSIQDLNGCPILFDTVQVYQPDAIFLSTILILPSCNGQNDGEILIDTINGGTPGYSYLWSNGQSGTIINNLYGDSTYSCVVTDAFGCQDSSYSVNLPQPDSLVVSINSLINYNGTDVRCYGDANGSILANVSGGSGLGTYTYEWRENNIVIAQTNTLNNIGAGSYVVTITDTNGCSVNATSNITDPLPISITDSVSIYNGSNISCSDSLDGSIYTIISGGNGINFNSILWNTSQTTSSITGLSSGFYQLTVSDINGCIDTLEVTLTQPNPISLSFTVNPVTCFGGNDGSAVVNPNGGTAPYQISWSTGSVNNSIFGLNGLTNYIVQVSDTNNCPMVLDTISIPQPDSIQTTEIITLPTCYGNTDGQIIITNVTGATGPYTYLWNDTLGSTGTILPNLTSGEYICTITDVFGCSEDVLFLVDTVYTVIASATVISDYQGAHVECYGDANATILGSATGGTPPYSYTWSTQQNTDTVTNLGAGAYTVFVTDSNNCSSFATVYVLNPDSISANIQVSDYNSYQISCDGFNDGSAIAVVSGGNGIDYNTLLWNTGNTNDTINNLVVGNYSYTIEDINGCSADAQVILISSPLMQLNLSSTSLSCFGDSNATATINNLTNGIAPFDYSWSNGDTLATSVNLSSDSYSLTVIDDNGCSVSSSVFVLQPDSLFSNLTITSSYNGYDISCYDSSDASVSVSTIGGVAPFLYSLDSNVYFTNTNYNNLGIGLFDVYTQDANGCISLSSITISSPNQLDADLEILVSPTCDGLNDGVLRSNTTGGTTPTYSYDWSNNGSNTNVINSLSIGMYSVVITDNNGCSISDSIMLNPVFSLSSSTSSTQVSCTGSSDGTANVIVSGGSSPYVYQWNNGSNGPNIVGLSAAIYNVIITDNNGCFVADSVLITESDSALAFTSNITDLNCFQDNTGSISISVVGGIGNYMYLWSNGDTSSSISNLIASTYIVIVTDSAGCVVSDSLTVSEPLNLTYNLSSTNISCFGLSDGFTDIVVSGGVLPYSYNWSGPGNFSSTDTSINFLSSGVYNIIVTDTNGCSIGDSIAINEPLPLVSVVSSENPLCYNSSDGAIYINVEGGVGPYSSTYGLINPTNIINDFISYENLSSSSNTLFIYDANNCENSYNITLINPLELVIDSINSYNPSCHNYSNGGASINVIGGTLPYVYELLDANNNVITSSSNNSNLSFGTYIYEVVDHNECKDTVSFNISNPNEISIISTSVTDVNCFGDNTGEIEVSVNNTVGSYDIVWLNSSVNTDSELITELIAGKYEVIVVDEFGCTKLDSFFVNQNDEIIVDISSTNASCKLSADGQINIDNISGGVSPFNIYNNASLVSDEVVNSYIIESLLTTDEINPYSVLITDNFNCEYLASIEIGFDGGFNCINEPVVITPNFDNYNDVWVPILDLNTNIEVTILNRWGQKEFYYSGNSLSFSWNGLANWDGERELPSSDYYYIIKFNNDSYPAKTGVITLIR
jgi:gliding motility-associated-like protein